jgi:hypothetical protein
MAKLDKKAVDTAIDTTIDAAGQAMAKTGETGSNTSIGLEAKDKKGKGKMKKGLKQLGEAFKEDPAGIIGEATDALREPLVEYQEKQREKQAVPTADQLGPEPVNLAAAFNI